MKKEQFVSTWYFSGYVTWDKPSLFTIKVDGDAVKTKTEADKIRSEMPESIEREIIFLIK